MDKSEEIEEFLEKEIEKLDKEFLENLKTIKDRKQLEEDYKTKLKKLRGNFADLYENFLKEEKKRSLEELEKKKNPEKKKGKVKRFKVKKANFKLSSREKIHFKYDLFKFKSKIKLNNFLRKITSHFLRILYIKIKFKMKKIFSSIKNLVINSISKIRAIIASILKKTKKILIKIFSKIEKTISAVIRKIFSIFKKKKQKESAESEDQKIAEKILNQTKS